MQFFKWTSSDSSLQIISQAKAKPMLDKLKRIYSMVCFFFGMNYFKIDKTLKLKYWKQAQESKAPSWTFKVTWSGGSKGRCTQVWAHLSQIPACFFACLFIFEFYFSWSLLHILVGPRLFLPALLNTVSIIFQMMFVSHLTELGKYKGWSHLPFTWYKDWGDFSELKRMMVKHPVSKKCLGSRGCCFNARVCKGT